MLSYLANPARFMKASRWLAPLFGALAATLLALGLWLALHAPDDYQQGATVKIMFVHVPAAILASVVYGVLGACSFAGLVFRHALADSAAKAAAPLGAAFTALALATGSLWGRPMWGTGWAWDAGMTSVLVLLLLYLGYIALHAALDDETKAARAAAILALVGLVNLPVVKFSVDWWNTLHQGASLLKPGAMASIYKTPLLIMVGAYACLFASLWLVGIRAEVWRRRANSAAFARAAA